MRRHANTTSAGVGSKRANSALELSAWVANDRGAGLFAIHVLPAPPGRPFLAIQHQRPTLRESLLGRVNAWHSPSEIATIGHLAACAPSEAVVRFAKENHSELIVIGSLGRCGLWLAVLRGVIEEVAARADCPVTKARPHHRNGRNRHAQV